MRALRAAGQATWAATVAQTRAVVETVDAAAQHLPDSAAGMHRAAAAGLLVSVLHEADAWDEYLESATLQEQMRTAEAIRAEAIQAVMADARGDEDYYAVMARKLNRG